MKNPSCENISTRVRLDKVLLPKFRPHLCKGLFTSSQFTSSWDDIRLSGTNWRLRRVVCLNFLCSTKIDLTFLQTCRTGKMGPPCPLGSTRCNSPENEYVCPCSHAGWLIASAFFGVLLREHGKQARH